MTKEHKHRVEITAFDISYSPVVRELAEEVARTRTAKSLTDGGKEIARIVPARKSTKHKKIDPLKLRVAFEKAGAAMEGIDPDELIADIYRAREEGSRPPTRP
jgi:hypothetical protein